MSKCKLENCNSTKLITDVDNGETFCANCGSVTDEKTYSYSKNQTSGFGEFMTNTQAGPKNSLQIYDKGMNTVIGEKDFSGKSLTANKSTFHRLRLWDRRSKAMKSSQSTLRKSLLLLNGMEEKLGLPDFTLENTAYLFRKAVDAKLTRGRDAVSLMCAALYISCRQTSTPRNMMEIARVGNITKKTLQKGVRVLIRRLNLEVPQYNASSFITRLSNNMGFNEKTKRFAINILSDTEARGMSEGKNPMGHAAASLYVASIINGYSVSQREFAELSNVSTVTLRKRISAIRTTLSL